MTSVSRFRGQGHVAHMRHAVTTLAHLAWHAMCCTMAGGCLYLGPPWSLDVNTPPQIVWVRPEGDTLVMDDTVKLATVHVVDDDDDDLSNGFSWIAGETVLEPSEPNNPNGYQVLAPTETNPEWRSYAYIGIELVNQGSQVLVRVSDGQASVQQEWTAVVP